MRKKSSGKNYSSQKYIQIQFKAFPDRTRSFRFNRKKRNQKFKIPFCNKSIRDTKNMLRSTVVFFNRSINLL